jgi:hypothetical protein
MRSETTAPTLKIMATRNPTVTPDEVITFYETHYGLLGSWLLRPGDKIMLGDKKKRVCRFCGKSPPDVTFKKVAHAIPELLGNKSIESAYECGEGAILLEKGVGMHPA